MSPRRRNALPGFGLTLGFSVLYLSLIVLIPLSAAFFSTAGMSSEKFWNTVGSARALASYRLTFGASLAAALVNAVAGLGVAWTLTRYRFPGRNVLDAMVDLPFALPTAVAGIALTTLYAPNGWFGSLLPFRVAYTPLGVSLALLFIGLPFVVRTVQPVLADLAPELEEAALSLGATGWQTFRRVVFPEIFPALLTGFALAFARALGEYGSVVFISGNLPMKTEITPLLIITRLEQYDYRGATALAVVMLVVSFVLLLLINLLQKWAGRGRAVGRKAEGGMKTVTPTDSAPSAALRPPPSAFRLPPSSVGTSPLARVLCIGGTILFLTLFLLMPLVTVFVEAFRKGAMVYFDALREPVAWAAIKLTLLTAALAVPLNTLFGVAAAWAVTRFRFPGRSLLLTLIDLPFAVSPVVAGLIYVLIFGRNGWLGPWLTEHNVKIIFAVPGIVLATVFVTFPFVARELIPLMEAQGSDDELAALSLGASPWQMFYRVTLPNIRWGLLYGVILCNARAMGEFGAVSVVSGHIRGQTNTIPLHVEILYNEYQFAAAFAVASLLAGLALVTLVLKQIVGRKAAPAD